MTVSHGIVEVTKAQLDRRGHALRPLVESKAPIPDPVRCAVEQQTGFKHGEVFGWDDVPNKTLASMVEAETKPWTPPAVTAPKRSRKKSS
jgi:hypothetical protein